MPILVAVNKIDKEGAQPDRVRTEMTQLGLQPEEWGGETMFVDVSAKARTNLEDLLESILLLAEVEELKANPDVDASGVVIESKLDPGRGAVVTVLVNRGTLRVGDAIVAGAHWGRVRALHDYKGNKVKEATPSSRSRCSASTPSPRPASTCASWRTTAAPGSSRRSAGSASRARPRRAARSAPGRSRRSSRTPAAARCRSSTSCSRRTCPARSRRSRTRSPSCPSPRSRCRSSCPASAASPNPTSCSRRPPTRSCSASTCAPSARRARSPTARAWRSAPTR